MDNQDLYLNLIGRAQDLLIAAGTTGTVPANFQLKDILDSADEVISTVGNITIEEMRSPKKASADAMSDASISVHDSRLINICCSVMEDTVKNIDANLHSFDSGLFTDNVVCHLETGRGEMDWSRLDELAANCFGVVSSFTPFLGALPDTAPPPRERKARAAANAGPATQTKRPVNVTSQNAKENESQDISEMGPLLNVLLKQEYIRNNSKPLCYYRFLMDPRSFGASVENMFHMSFLVKENKAALGEDERGLPVLAPAREKRSESTKHSRPNQQMITSLNPGQWREIIRLLKIKEPTVKRRLPAEVESIAGPSRR